MFEQMIYFEKQLYEKGIRYIAGVDEVGRGPLAGPLVVCAVILNLEEVLSLYPSKLESKNELYTQIRDSKQLSERKRSIISQFLINEAVDYSIASITNTELDTLGLSQALQKAFFNSVYNLKIKPEQILTDNIEIKKITREHQLNIIRGDSKSITIAAASIIAKVHRDTYMKKMHDKYPEYGFHKHKGYGTFMHMEKLNKHGPCEIHRRSFEPVRKLINF